jgi:6-phosphogluconolactonase (cycloisomerase 2 family)
VSDCVGTPGANQVPRNTDNDIWASDLHLTPNGRFLYAAERTSSTLAAFCVDTASGKLTYLGSTPTVAGHDNEAAGWVDIETAGLLLDASK